MALLAPKGAVGQDVGFLVQLVLLDKLVRVANGCGFEAKGRERGCHDKVCNGGVGLEANGRERAATTSRGYWREI
jgi:hypothetical protein